MFQEGYDPVCEQAFREIARLTRGAYCRFAPGAARRAARVVARRRRLCRRRHESARRPSGAALVGRTAGCSSSSNSHAPYSRRRRSHPAACGPSAPSPRPTRSRPHAFCAPSAAAARCCFAAFLLFRGEIGVAIPVGTVGLGLLGWLSLWPASFGRRTQKAPGQASQVRSAFLEMELDHDSGAMRGRIIAGRYEGVSLDALDLPTLVGFIGEIDDDSRQLLMAYLDRRQPGWREHAQGNAAAGQAGAARPAAK